MNQASSDPVRGPQENTPPTGAEGEREPAAVPERVDGWPEPQGVSLRLTPTGPPIDPQVVAEVRRIVARAHDLLGLPEEDPAYLRAVAHGFLRMPPVVVTLWDWRDDPWQQHGPGWCPDGAHQ